MSIVEDPLLWIDGCVKITATGIAAIVEIFEASWIYAITTSKGFHLHQPMTLYPPPITYHLSPITYHLSTPAPAPVPAPTLALVEAQRFLAPRPALLGHLRPRPARVGS